MKTPLNHSHRLVLITLALVLVGAYHFVDTFLDALLEFAVHAN